MDIKTKAMENLSESFKPQDDSSFVSRTLIFIDLLYSLD